VVVFFLAGCTEGVPPRARRPADSPDGHGRDFVTLSKPIGITTAGDVFTPLVQAGTLLPHTISQTFTNKTDGGPHVLVTLSQKDETGVETIASLMIEIPPVADNSLQITVTLKISKDKKMKVKTTVSESATVREYGPFPVE
jgi:molecular chaperone DnaK (HSP70)